MNAAEQVARLKELQKQIKAAVSECIDMKEAGPEVEAHDWRWAHEVYYFVNSRDHESGTSMGRIIEILEARAEREASQAA